MNAAFPPALAPFADAISEAIRDALEKAASTQVRLRSEPAEGPRDAAAVVGLSGPSRGALALVLSEEVACRLASRLVGRSFEQLDADAAGCVGDAAALVANRVQVALAGTEVGVLDASLPVVHLGSDQGVVFPRDVPKVELALDSDLGSFEVILAIERQATRVPRVLIADDSRVMRKLLRTALRELAPQIEIVEAENGAKARTLLAGAEDRFDLVVLDLHMPEVSGVELLEELRRKPRGVKTPVLVATSDPDADALVAGAIRRAGATGPLRVIKKPFSPDELRAAAREIAGPAIAGA